MSREQGLATAPSGVESELATAPFSAAIADAERLIASADFAETDADLAGATTISPARSRRSCSCAGPQQGPPYFVTSTGPYSKMGLDNPDTIYAVAVVEPDATYVVRGRRGSTTDLSFQVCAGILGGLGARRGIPHSTTVVRPLPRTARSS